MEVEADGDFDAMFSDAPAASEEDLELDSMFASTPAQDEDDLDPLSGMGDGPSLDIGQLDDEALPVLKVDTTSPIRIRTGDDPFPVRIQIENAGQGQMSGSVYCSADWVEISPKHLNPNRREHSIEVLVDPSKIPGNSAQTTIEITTGHGESQEIVLDALKHLISPKLKLIVAGLLVLGLLSVFGLAYLGGELTNDPPPPPRTILAVHVDPPAGEVFVDDVLVGRKGTLSMVENFPVGKPFLVRVELDGFQPWSKTVTVPEGQQLRVEAELELRDPMDFEVTPQMQRSDFDQTSLKSELQLRSTNFEHCFTRHLKPDSAYNAALTLRGTVSQRGYVSAIEFRGSNFESAEVRACLSRQLRGLKLPVLPGDYATFDHTFRTRVGPRRSAITVEEAK
jgi:hypothetical protein